ncbi:MAG: hypothetical protein AB8U78_07100 [Rickettsia slovaca]|uniref:Poly(3-hydroxyalkanoate) synthetase n=1 Tax=Rickettsia slovaca str. D-CWPP TaxID=1105109 RepID=H8LLY7_RICSL|nr:hypothetical protein [Rickettsia slovaca]AFD20253.1 Poly(3-hydroxyalkanoate) synthetase [Rickettsia slovaca str. D-CWPP]
MKATEYKGSWWNYWLNWLIKNNDNKLVDSLDYQNLEVIEEAPELRKEVGVVCGDTKSSLRAAIGCMAIS